MTIVTLKYKKLFGSFTFNQLITVTTPSISCWCHYLHCPCCFRVCFVALHSFISTTLSTLRWSLNFRFIFVVQTRSCHLTRSFLFYFLRLPAFSPVSPDISSPDSTVSPSRWCFFCGWLCFSGAYIKLRGFEETKEKPKNGHISAERHSRRKDWLNIQVGINGKEHDICLSCSSKKVLIVSF